MTTPRKPPLGITDFWAPKKTEQKPPQVKPGDLVSVRFPGRIFYIVFDAPDAVHARATLGRIVKLLLTQPEGQRAFERQSVFLVPPAQSRVALVLGDITVYGTASSTDHKTAIRMLIDRIALAMTECRVSNPETDNIYKTINLRIVRNT